MDRERYRREMLDYTRSDSGRDAKRSRHDADGSAAARSNKEDEKLARDVSLQQQRAAARGRRDRPEQRQSEESDEAQSGGEQSHSDGGSHEQGSADEEEEQE